MRFLDLFFSFAGKTYRTKVKVCTHNDDDDDNGKIHFCLLENLYLMNQWIEGLKLNCHYAMQRILNLWFFFLLGKKFLSVHEMQSTF